MKKNMRVCIVVVYVYIFFRTYRTEMLVGFERMSVFEVVGFWVRYMELLVFVFQELINFCCTLPRGVTLAGFQLLHAIHV